VNLALPLDDEKVARLRSGDYLLLSGTIYSARDAAHRRIIAALDRGDPPPFPLCDAVIYYMGPSPAPPGRAIGSAGPTTSGRMDSLTPRLLAEGLRGMIGKGHRNEEVLEAIQKYRAVYFATLGGAGALLSHCIKKADLIAYEDLGAEAVLKLEVENFPVWVVNDIYGGDLYAEGKKIYALG
jgi:fumarate hydratase subunit beta